MFKRRVAFCLMAGLLAAAMPAEARWGSHSGGSRSSSSSSSKKGNSRYIERQCKTAACFKKHPSGHYGFVPGQRKSKK